MKYALAALAAALIALAFVFWNDLTVLFLHFYHFLQNEQQVREYVGGFGAAAPAVFMGIQILQVLLAPIPGEVSGFIGGYLFGAAPGFIYSSIALAAGSWLNFFIGRLVGRGWVRKMIPAKQLEKFDRTVRHQGTIILFFLFVFPGFPKDFLCLFLGLTAISPKVFLLIASVGRMPGTLMLSLQGAYLFDKNYGLLFGLTLVCCLLAAGSWYFRETVYRWIDKMNGNDSK